MKGVSMWTRITVLAGTVLVVVAVLALSRVAWAAGSLVVTKTVPSAGATGVAPTANIDAYFNHDVAASTVTSRKFKIRKKGTTTWLSATRSVDNTISPTSTNGLSESMATLNPSADLAPNTIYQVVIVGGTTGVKGVNGEILSTNKRWTFTTSTTSPPSDPTPPETSISAGPSDATNDSTPTFTFTGSDNVGVSSFECRVYATGGPVSAYGSCTSPYTTSPLVDGSYSFEVRAKDAANNVDDTPASRGFTVDTAAPDTSITSGPAEGATESAGSPSFGFSSTEPGSTFECKLDAGSYASCTSPNGYSNLANGSHTFSVRATDPASNADATPASRTWTVGVTTSGDPVFVGAGDIASCNLSYGDEATANLLDGIPGTVYTLGDNVYNSATDANFANCYDPSWGRHKARTMPIVGNHDYSTAGASGYFNYFGPVAGDRSKGYYSYDLGAWHIVALNSMCENVGGCEATSPMVTWLKKDLADHPKECTLALWHHPVFSSGSEHGSDPKMIPSWDALHAAGAEVVLSAHDHDYERFAPQTFDPQTSRWVADPDRGIREFVVGTGGKSHYAFGNILANSEVRNSDTYGVLKLTLHASSYDWQFVPVAGKTFSDSGSASCHGAPPPSGTQPDTMITSGSSGTITSNTATFAFSSSDTNSHFECKLEPTETAFSSCASPKSYGGLLNGSYTFSVRAIDAAGNIDASPATSSFTVSTTPQGSDTAAPRVVSTLPTTPATGVAAMTNVTATFSEDMLVSSITGTTFKLVRLNTDGTTTRVTAAVSYAAATKQAILDPASDLSPGQIYKATVTSGAQDLAGNALDQKPTIAGNQSESWKFTVQ